MFSPGVHSAPTMRVAGEHQSAAAGSGTIPRGRAALPTTTVAPGVLWHRAGSWLPSPSSSSFRLCRWRLSCASHTVYGPHTAVQQGSGRVNTAQLTQRWGRVHGEAATGWVWVGPPDTSPVRAWGWAVEPPCQGDLCLATSLMTALLSDRLFRFWVSWGGLAGCSKMLPSAESTNTGWNRSPRGAFKQEWLCKLVLGGRKTSSVIR